MTPASPPRLAIEARPPIASLQIGSKLVLHHMQLENGNAGAAKTDEALQTP